MKVALLGAESTGKTQLANALVQHWRAQGQAVHSVAEYLREWCERAGRTPRPHEQLGIAQEQARRALAAAPGDLLVADTTPLMVAIYSDMLFNDRSLYEFALAHQRHYDVTLVMGLDLPWVADGLQRDGPQVRLPVDALLRGALERAGVAYRVVYGSGNARLEQALSAINFIVAPAYSTRATSHFDQKPAAWRWACDKCSDPDCEHRLFTGLSG